MRTGYTIDNVQMPIIPLVGAWTRNTPGTLSLGQGMVSYPPPDEAMLAIRAFGAQAEDHLYGAHLGNTRLIELLKAKLLAENQLDCADGYQIVITAGANMAFLSVLMAILDPGDEVILPVPYYFNQEMAIQMLNAVPVLVSTDPEYQLQLDAIKAAITSKTRAIVTVSPNNPTGAVYSEAALRAVNALCQEYGLYHISDEAYEYFVYDGAKHFSPASIEGAAPHTISLYSLSKAYGFASWRVGYAVVPEALITALMKVQDTNLICPPLITQHAAIAAVEVGSRYCLSKIQALSEVRSLVIAMLQESPHVYPITPTAGAFYQFIKLKTPFKDVDLVQALIKDHQVAVIPGSAFGMEEGCYLRVSYGMLDMERCRIAMQRLIQGIGCIAF